MTTGTSRYDGPHTSDTCWRQVGLWLIPATVMARAQAAVDRASLDSAVPVGTPRTTPGSRMIDGFGPAPVDRGRAASVHTALGGWSRDLGDEAWPREADALVDFEKAFVRAEKLTVLEAAVMLATFDATGPRASLASALAERESARRAATPPRLAKLVEAAREGGVAARGELQHLLAAAECEMYFLRMRGGFRDQPWLLDAVDHASTQVGIAREDTGLARVRLVGNALSYLWDAATNGYALKDADAQDLRLLVEEAAAGNAFADDRFRCLVARAIDRGHIETADALLRAALDDRTDPRWGQSLLEDFCIANPPWATGHGEDADTAWPSPRALHRVTATLGGGPSRRRYVRGCDAPAARRGRRAEARREGYRGPAARIEDRQTRRTRWTR